MFLLLTLYGTSNFLMAPNIAPFFGRVKIEDSNRIKAHSIINQLFNRKYVSPKMQSVLNDISLKVSKDLPGIKLIYLDANFPFFDGFPLFPHLSHNDGRKIDISFIYEDKEKKISNLKPSISGYGIFEKPRKGEINQSLTCKQNGFWQYDFTKHLTLDSNYKDLRFSKSATKTLINNILSNANVSTVFIEPHLKNRINLNNSKIHFHGCRAVRHDDHIHFQIH